jgi:hypothetical protein
LLTLFYSFSAIGAIIPSTLLATASNAGLPSAGQGLQLVSKFLKYLQAFPSDIFLHGLPARLAHSHQNRQGASTTKEPRISAVPMMNPGMITKSMVDKKATACATAPQCHTVRATQA